MDSRWQSAVNGAHTLELWYEFSKPGGNAYLPTVLSVNGGQTISLFTHAMHGIPNPSAELWMLDFVCNPALPRRWHYHSPSRNKWQRESVWLKRGESVRWVLGELPHTA